MIYLKEWEELINELSTKEISLIKNKEELECTSTKLIFEANQLKEKTEVDIIKKKYGGNNEKTRKQYVKDNTQKLSKEIQDLEISIAWIKNRIEFIKGLINYVNSENYKLFLRNNEL